MHKIYVFLEAHDRRAGEELAKLLQQDGYDVDVAIVPRFPVADPLAHRLSSARSQFDAVVVLLSHSSGRATWLLRELQTQRSIQQTMGGGAMMVTVFMGDVQIPAWMGETADGYTVVTKPDDLYPSVLGILRRGHAEQRGGSVSIGKR